MSRWFLLERIRINIEIFFESIGDFLSHSKLRKPLLLLVAVALVLTLRSGRKGVRTMKPGLTAGAHDLPNYRPPAASSLGSNPAISAPYSRSMGQTGYSGSSRSSYASDLSLGSSTGPSRATADLVDAHGSSVRVMDAAAFRDYGGVTEFHGPIETLQAYEGAGVVEKVLQSQGNGRILLVDGSGNTQSAVFDASAARTAQRNGWKGVIIHGVVRDSTTLSSFPIGVKALGASPIRGRATSGSKGSTLNIAGMQLAPGDWVYADKDGIVVSDRELEIPKSQRQTSSMGTGNTGSTYTRGGSRSSMSETYSGTSSETGHQTGGFQTSMTSTGSTYGSSMGATMPQAMGGGTSYGSSTASSMGRYEPNSAYDPPPQLSRGSSYAQGRGTTSRLPYLQAGERPYTYSSAYSRCNIWPSILFMSIASILIVFQC